MLLRWLRRAFRVVFLRRPRATVGLLAAATAVVATGSGWVEGFWPRAGVVGVAVLLAVTGVVWDQRPRELPGTRDVPDMIPMELPELFGRDQLVAQLIEEERRMREGDANGSAEDPGRPGPRLILLHGKPGVGKTLLAQHLAKQLAKHYPDGNLDGRLGTTNDRSPAAILVRFLTGLGLSEAEATVADADKRYDIFLAKTTKKRILVLLDGVRNYDQLREVMPSEPNCLVIVTSRGDLGPYVASRSHLLTEPDADAAERILLAYAGDEPRCPPDRVAQIVEQCGRLPFALRAAGERARVEPNGLDAVAASMLDRATRLEHLSSGSRNTADRIGSEYDKLLANEKQAFRMLSLVQAASFVPWVLQPLLNIDHDEADRLLVRLLQAQLVDPADKDAMGVARYRLHPLFRLFAERELTKDSPAEVAKARANLELAYAAAAGHVLELLEPGFRTTLECPDGHLPHGPQWRDRIARLRASWMPTEYANLIGAVHAAYGAGDWGTCWRIAAVLDAPPPSIDYLVDPDDFRRSAGKAFDLAMIAADRDSATHATDAVRLAKAMHLVSAEEHVAAIVVLDENPKPGAIDHRVKATELRIRAQCLMLRSLHREAEPVLWSAFAEAMAVDATDEQNMIKFLQGVNNYVLKPGDRREVAAFKEAVAANDGTMKISAMLWLAQATARDGDPAAGANSLRNAYTEACFSAAGRAQVLLAHAAQTLIGLQDTATRLGGRAPDADPSTAVHLAAQAVWAHCVVHCTMGVIHSRALLARALLLAGRASDAEEQIREADRAFARLTPQPVAKLVPALRANLKLAMGELGLYRDTASSAAEDLAEALELFQYAGDAWHAARTRLALGAAYGNLGRYRAALAQLWAAVTELRDCGDRTGALAACAQLERTYRDSGLPMNGRRRKALRSICTG